MPPPIRLLIVDDHKLIREGIRAVMQFQSEFKVVGEANDGEEAVALARTLQPDVILMDLVLPRRSGVEAIAQIRAENPAARILVLSSFAEDARIKAALQAGALGYLLKDSDPEELLHAIRQVYQGEYALHPEVTRRLVHELHTLAETAAAPPAASKVNALTEREREVLRLAAQGCTNKSIAQRLSITEATVRSHMSSLLNKLSLESRTQAVLLALHAGLGQPPASPPPP
jgi:NarL family two-component system response regulator LiaR